MIGSISKDRLPKGLVYVLKTSQLTKALIDAGIECYVDLIYYNNRVETLLDAKYWLPNKNVDYPRVYLVSGVVYPALRVAASEALMTTGLPLFILWLQAVRTLPDNSTAWLKTPYFHATYTEGRLDVTCHLEL